MTFETQPLVSICMATYNGAETVKRALESAINQTYENIEILVFDDASSDATFEIIKSMKTTRTVILNRNNERLGMSDNYNNFLSHASGEFLVLFDQDDYRSATFVQNAVTELQKDHTTCVVLPSISVNFLKEPQHINEYRYWGNAKTPRSRVWAFLRRPTDFIPYGLLRTSALKDIGGWTVSNSSFHRIAFGLITFGNVKHIQDDFMYYQAKGAVGRPTPFEERQRNSSSQSSKFSRFFRLLEFHSSYTQIIWRVSKFSYFHKLGLTGLVWLDFLLKSALKIFNTLILSGFKRNLPKPVFDFLVYLTYPTDNIEFLTNPKNTESGYYKLNWPLS